MRNYKNIIAVAAIALLSGCTSIDWNRGDITLTDAEIRAMEVVETMPPELWEDGAVETSVVIKQKSDTLDVKAKPRPVVIPQGEPAPQIVVVEIEDISLPVVIEVATEKLPAPFMLKEVNYNDKNLLCLAQNIYFEARSETTDGMLAVGLVTMNRVDSAKYPDTICEVVWQRKQFSWTHDGKSDTPSNRRAWRVAAALAEIVLDSYNTTDYDFTHGALWYHADYVKPDWSIRAKPSRTIGKHIFYASL